MGSFDCFKAKVKRATLRVGADGCVAGVRERTGLAIAESRDIVFVAAKSLSLGVKPAEKLLAGAGNHRLFE